MRIPAGAVGRNGIKNTNKKTIMKTFLIEFELPPLRAIYRDEIVAENGCEANRIFQEDNPKARIRKITQVGDLEDDFGDEPAPVRQCNVNGEECDTCQ